MANFLLDRTAIEEMCSLVFTESKSNSGVSWGLFCFCFSLLTINGMEKSVPQFPQKIWSRLSTERYCYETHSLFEWNQMWKSLSCAPPCAAWYVRLVFRQIATEKRGSASIDGREFIRDLEDSISWWTVALLLIFRLICLVQDPKRVFLFLCVVSVLSPFSLKQDIMENFAFSFLFLKKLYVVGFGWHRASGFSLFSYHFV